MTDDKIYVRVNTADINFFNRIMEGWEYCGIVTSLPEKGRLVVQTTPDMRDEAIEIIKNMPVPVKIETE